MTSITTLHAKDPEELLNVEKGPAVEIVAERRAVGGAPITCPVVLVKWRRPRKSPVRTNRAGM